CLAVGDAADRRVACRPPCNRRNGCSVACHRTPGRLVQPLSGSSRGNSNRNAWHVSSRIGSRRLLRIIAQVDADSQRWRQARPRLDRCVVEPALVAKGQHRASSPYLDVALQGAYLAIGKLAGVALLQFVEHRSAIPFRLRRQPIADLLPHGFERIRAAAVRARALGLLTPSILPSVTRARWQADRGTSGYLVTVQA